MTEQWNDDDENKNRNIVEDIHRFVRVFGCFSVLFIINVDKRRNVIVMKEHRFFFRSDRERETERERARKKEEEEMKKRRSSLDEQGTDEVLLFSLSCRTNRYK